MTEFPDDVQAAIEWFAEADREHTAACQEYDRTFGEAYVDQAGRKREERSLSLSFSGQVEHTIATLSALPARKIRDGWMLECTRRGNWLAYLISRETGSHVKYDAPTKTSFDR